MIYFESLLFTRMSRVLRSSTHLFRQKDWSTVHTQMRPQDLWKQTHHQSQRYFCVIKFPIFFDVSLLCFLLLFCVVAVAVVIILGVFSFCILLFVVIVVFCVGEWGWGWGSSFVVYFSSISAAMFVDTLAVFPEVWGFVVCFDVYLVEFISTLYLSHVRWSYRRRLGSLLLWACVQCVTSIVRAQLLPIVCWFNLSTCLKIRRWRVWPQDSPPLHTKSVRTCPWPLVQHGSLCGHIRSGNIARPETANAEEAEVTCVFSNYKNRTWYTQWT